MREGGKAGSQDEDDSGSGGEAERRKEGTGCCLVALCACIPHSPSGLTPAWSGQSQSTFAVGTLTGVKMALIR